MITQYKNVLKQGISSMLPLKEEELNAIVDQFKFQEVAKHGHLLSGGQVSKRFYYIIDGLVRVYYLQDDREVTTFLATNNCFVTSPVSFIRQVRSDDFIQCLEDTVVASISYNKMQELHEQVPAWNAVTRQFMEQNLLCLSERFLKQHNIKARDKYLKFLSTTPARIVQRTPIQHIASFLGITPESLSRIRKELATEA
ncbi:Crp/Fnr family transcriptional regulator [Fulvivirga ulvae]|uniref:Crp/Fnr family transcriptional regulator n=1 Tax=Fulvivirga ulvae TaxID=2904245 RepID=UPI001F1A747D|nr:Crp/Fnr family transcriptional regulator [Fulvivirga ulvae]UII29732.1 Crp/Fnr family transcriptional regulator [Fulvivirga ulvae]